jgi:hypothetical protein
MVRKRLSITIVDRRRMVLYLARAVSTDALFWVRRSVLGSTPCSGFDDLFWRTGMGEGGSESVCVRERERGGEREGVRARERAREGGSEREKRESERERRERESEREKRKRECVCVSWAEKREN